MVQASGRGWLEALTGMLPLYGEFYRSPRGQLFWMRDDGMLLWGENSKKWVEVPAHFFVRKSIAPDDLQREDRDAYEAAVEDDPR